jgi:membrane-associated protease RseP (regulator of RpoE activity)
VNPGNSGGALVNTRGELIGINTMISSQTGSYVGYSFAIPSNITRKIIEDIMEFGNVQRGILGVEGGELNSSASKELGIKETEGFYIKRVRKNSGAEKSGLTKGDIIIQLDTQKISSFAELNGYIGTKRPNDKIQVTFIRNEKTMTVPVTLSKSDVMSTQFKGLDLENINVADKKKYRINYGVKIKDDDDEVEDDKIDDKPINNKVEETKIDEDEDIDILDQINMYEKYIRVLRKKFVEKSNKTIKATKQETKQEPKQEPAKERKVPKKVIITKKVLITNSEYDESDFEIDFN